MRPGDQELEGLIQAAFDRLPDPDPTRLKALEARVVRRAPRASEHKRSRTIYWWLVLGLAATGAAAWWSGEYFRREPEPAPVERRTEPGSALRTESAPDRRPEQGKRAAPSGGEREIYRRERY